MLVLQILGWILVLLLAGFGSFIFATQYTYRFCTYALWVIAGTITAFLLLGIWGLFAPLAAKTISLILMIILTLVLLATVITARRIGATAARNTGESDYLIVLGCTVDGSRPSKMLQYRIDTACEYLNKYPNTRCIVTGGLGDKDTITEARCMMNTLTAMGIDPDRIWLEEQATTTVENLTYSMALLQDKAPGSLAILSSEFHLYRVEKMAAKLGMNAQTLAAPTQKKILLLNNIIREIPAVWFYEITGG